MYFLWFFTSDWILDFTYFERHFDISYKSRDSDATSKTKNLIIIIIQRERRE